MQTSNTMMYLPLICNVSNKMLNIKERSSPDFLALLEIPRFCLYCSEAILEKTCEHASTARGNFSELWKLSTIQNVEIDLEINK